MPMTDSVWDVIARAILRRVAQCAPREEVDYWLRAAENPDPVAEIGRHNIAWWFWLPGPDIAGALWRGLPQMPMTDNNRPSG